MKWSNKRKKLRDRNEYGTIENIENQIVRKPLVESLNVAYGEVKMRKSEPCSNLKS